jgi:hypothetical protein
MADVSGGLLGNYLDGLDENQQRMAISSGLLGLGSSLLANQYVDPRNPGSGGIAKGLAEGAGAMMQAPQQARMQAYQDVVTKAKLAELQRQQKQQAAVDQWMETNRSNLGAYGIAPGTEGLYTSDQIAKLMAERAGKRLEMKDKIELEPQLTSANEQAKNIPLAQRRLLEGQVDLQIQPQLEASKFAAVNPHAIARASGEANARNASDLAYALPKGQAAATVDAMKFNTPVTVDGKQMPLGMAQTYVGQRGKDMAEQQSPETQKANQEAAVNYDIMMSQISEVKNHPGLSKGTGKSGVLFRLSPGSPEYDFEASLGTLKSQAFVQGVEKLRGLGAMSEREGQEVKTSLAALDPKMSEEAFRRELDKIERITNAAAARLAQRTRGGSMPSGGTDYKSRYGLE